MRPGAMNRNTATFLNVTNNTDIDDTLLSVQSELAKVVELHETYEKEKDMMGMRHVDYIIIPKKSRTINTW
jgi:copper(I)-binding protein